MLFSKKDDSKLSIEAIFKIWVSVCRMIQRVRSTHQINHFSMDGNSTIIDFVSAYPGNK